MAGWLAVVCRSDPWARRVLSGGWIYALLGGSWALAVPAALVDTPLPLLPLFLLIYTLTDGIGEELAWRGVGLPLLLTRYSALVASLDLGLVWAVWHLPLLLDR